MMFSRSLTILSIILIQWSLCCKESSDPASSEGPKPWQYTVPLMLEPRTETDWSETVALLKMVEADRVLLVGPSEERGDRPPPSEFRELAEILKERKVLLETEDIDLGFWMWRTVGHGGEFILSPEEELPYQEIVGYDGQEAVKCFCPLDSDFRQYMREVFAAVAESGVELILLDDDFRLSWHPPEVTVGCYCPLHVAEFNKITGRRMTREQIVKAVLTGPPSQLRTEWLQLKKKTLIDFATEIEQSVHSVSPKTRIGLAMTRLLWEIDGTDVPAILKALAGDTRPLMRVGGAPYGLKQPNLLGPTIEMTLLQRQWLREFPEIELMSESDTWPHTRFQCAAAMLNAFQEGLMAAHFPGHLHYIFTYAPRPEHERGYVDMTRNSLSRYRTIWRFFESFTSDRGVSVLEFPYTWRHLVLPDDPQGAIDLSRQKGAAIGWLSRLGIPVANSDTAGPVVLEGTGWVTLGDEELAAVLERGALIDAGAAQQLRQRGIDVGIKSMTPVKAPVFEYFSEPEFAGRYAGEYIRLYMQRGKEVYQCELSPAARSVSLFEPQKGESFPASILYENPQGWRFCILPYNIRETFENNDGSQIFLDYAKQELITRALGWVNRSPLAVSIPGEPDVRLLVKENGSSTLIAVQVLRLDPLKEPVFRLDPGIDTSGPITLLLPGADVPTPFEDYIYAREGDYGYLTLKTTVPSMGMLCVKLEHQAR